MKKYLLIFFLVNFSWNTNAQCFINETMSEFKYTNYGILDTVLIEITDRQFLVKRYNCDDMNIFLDANIDSAFYIGLLEGVYFVSDSSSILFNRDYIVNSTKVSFFNKNGELKYILFFDDREHRLIGISKILTESKSMFEEFLLITQGDKLVEFKLVDLLSEKYIEQLLEGAYNERYLFKKEYLTVDFLNYYWLE